MTGFEQGVGKRRADQLLVERGLAESRAKAQALILAGVGLCRRAADRQGRRACSPTTRRSSSRGRDHPWVSRGGVKLAHALDHFAHRSSTGLVALDIGASTGGFTDVLLTHGAARVHAVDVGRGQLAWKLRQDPRVVVHERRQRALSDRAPKSPSRSTSSPAMRALSASRRCCRRRWRSPPSARALVALVKPQFEAGPAQVGKGGVVRDPEIHRAVCERVAAVGRRAAGLDGGRHRREPDHRPRRQPRIPALRAARGKAGEPPDCAGMTVR